MLKSNEADTVHHINPEVRLSKLVYEISFNYLPLIHIIFMVSEEIVI